MTRSLSVILLLLCSVVLLTSCSGQDVSVGDMTQEAIQIVNLGEAIDNLMDRINAQDEEIRRLQEENRRLQDGYTSNPSIESTSPTTPVNPTPPSELITVPTSVSDLFFDGGTVRVSGNVNATHSVGINSANQGGMTHNDAVVFSSTTSGSGGTRTTFNQFASFNLRRNYDVFIGYVGRTDGTIPVPSTITIFGDGQVLQEINLGETDFPIPLSLPISGISMLRVEIEHVRLTWASDRISTPAGEIAFAIVGLFE